MSKTDKVKDGRGMLLPTCFVFIELESVYEEIILLLF